MSSKKDIKEQEQSQEFLENHLKKNFSNENNQKYYTLEGTPFEYIRGMDTVYEGHQTPEFIVTFRKQPITREQFKTENEIRTWLDENKWMIMFSMAIRTSEIVYEKHKEEEALQIEKELLNLKSTT